NKVKLFVGFQKLASAYKKAKDPRWKPFDHFAASLREGNSIADTLHGWIRSTELFIIRAAEQTNLVHGIDKALFLIENKKKLNSIVIQLVYPLLMFFGLIAVLCLFAIGLFPQFAHISDVDSWGTSAKSFYYLGQVIQNYWPIFILLVGVIIFYSKWSV